MVAQNELRDSVDRQHANETQLLIDHQNEKQNIYKRHRVAIQMLKVSLPKGTNVRDQNFERA